MDTTSDEPVIKRPAPPTTLTGVAIMIGIGGAMLPGHTAAQNDSQTETTVTVRYIVNDVPASVEFYTTYMGFTVALNPGPGLRRWRAVHCGSP